MPGIGDEDDAAAHCAHCAAARRLAAMTRSGRFLPPGRRPVARLRSRAAHGPHVQPRRRSVPRRVPRVARGQRAAPAAAVGRHPRGLRRATSSGSARCSTRAARSCRGREEYGGRDATPVGVADLRGGVLPRRRAAAGHPERHLPARADDLRVRHAGAAGPHPARRWRAASRPWCQGWSEPNAGSDLAGIQSKAVRDDAAGGWRLNGQKTWTTRGAFCTHLFGLFRTDPDAERHRGLTYFLVASRRRGVTVRGGRAARRRRRLRRGLLRRRVRPRRRRARRAEPGLGASRWRPPAPSAASPCARPGRFLATARPARSTSYHARDELTTPTLRDRLVAAWIDAEAYRWQTFWTVTRIVEGARAGRGVER